MGWMYWAGMETCRDQFQSPDRTSKSYLPKCTKLPSQRYAYQAIVFCHEATFTKLGNLTSEIFLFALTTEIDKFLGYSLTRFTQMVLIQFLVKLWLRVARRGSPEPARPGGSPPLPTLPVGSYLPPTYAPTHPPEG